MTVDKALSYAKKKIHSDYAKLLLADLLSLNPLELLLHLQDEVPKDKLDIEYGEILPSIEDSLSLGSDEPDILIP